jgi:hypothetical protein
MVKQTDSIYYTILRLKDHMDNDELSPLISEMESVYPDLFEELRKKITFRQMSRQIPALLKKQ